LVPPPLGAVCGGGAGAGPSPTTDISGPAETLLLLLWGRTDLDDPRLQVEDRRRAQAVLAEPLTP